MPSVQPNDTLPMLEDFHDFFENSRTGFLATDTKGLIIRCNSTLSSWLNIPVENLLGKRFSDLLSIGGKIYYETHLWPLLRIQGFFEEVVLELINNNSEKIKVTINGYEKRNEQQEPLFIRLTLFKSNDRYLYEQNLRDAKVIAENNLSDEKALSVLREQFIAVLGHDLRNPLSSIKMGASILQTASLDEPYSKILTTIQNSAGRMAELISNVMDLARGRMGDGISLNLQRINLVPVLDHVVKELQTSFPERKIQTEFDITEPVVCDAPRLSQLLSNLLANALTHGAAHETVYVKGIFANNVFELSVSNSGDPIPPEALERLFHPFTRESVRPSQQGLGLGLFIASEIARAHKGELSVKSDNEETRFTFRMAHSI